MSDTDAARAEGAAAERARIVAMMREDVRHIREDVGVGDAPDPRCLTLEEMADRIERGET
jgi:hypothetical protein